MSVFKRAFHLAQLLHPGGGTSLEFGVYAGNSFLWQAEQILQKYPGAKLWGFDSWQGLPREAEGVYLPERHEEGKLAVGKDVVQKRLDALVGPGDARFRLIEGFFEQTLTPELKGELGNAIFVNIDVDLYISTVHVLDFLTQTLRPGAILYFDDWREPGDVHDASFGEERAFDEWAARHPEIECALLEVNPLNQRSFIVTRVGDQRIQGLKDIRYKAYALETDHFDVNFLEYLKIRDALMSHWLLAPMLKIVYKVLGVS